METKDLSLKIDATKIEVAGIKINSQLNVNLHIHL